MFNIWISKDVRKVEINLLFNVQHFELLMHKRVPPTHKMWINGNTRIRLLNWHLKVNLRFENYSFAMKIISHTKTYFDRSF